MSARHFLLQLSTPIPFLALTRGLPLPIPPQPMVYPTIFIAISTALTRMDFHATIRELSEPYFLHSDPVVPDSS
jgi:hypothetical protein